MVGVAKAEIGQTETPEGNDKCLEHAELAVVRDIVPADATRPTLLRSSVEPPDVGPPPDHLLAQPNAATDSCKQLATRPTRRGFTASRSSAVTVKQVMPSSIEIFTVRFSSKKFPLHR